MFEGFGELGLVVVGLVLWLFLGSGRVLDLFLDLLVMLLLQHLINHLDPLPHHHVTPHAQLPLPPLSPLVDETYNNSGEAALRGYEKESSDPIQLNHFLRLFHPQILPMHLSIRAKG